MLLLVVLVGSPPPGADVAPACHVRRSGAPDPRADTQWLALTPDVTGELSLEFENHGLIALGLEVFERAGRLLVSSARVDFPDGMPGPVRTSPVFVRGGAAYEYALTPLGPAGAWAACARGGAGSFPVNSEARSLAPKAGSPPKPAFTYAPALPSVGQAVAFDASTSRDDGAIVTYSWTFGDGAAGSGVQVTHAYATFGSFTVSLSVIDDSGKTGTISKAIRVTVPPTASYVYVPATPRVGEPVSFDASSSRDPDGTISTYAWTWGDGTSPTTVATSVAAHVYATHGTYRVTLRVTDADGLWAETAGRVTVYSPPLADFTFSPSSPLAGAIVAFDATASSDPDSAIVSYAWDFGDDSTGTGRATTHSYQSPGTFGVILRVSGSDGFSSSVTKVVRVLSPPIPSFTFTPTEPVARKSVAFDASMSSDPDGTIVAYAWAFGDGTTGTGAVVTHTFAREGSYTVTLTLTDSDGLTASLARTVSVSPYVPVPPSASFTFSPADPLTGQPVSFDARASTDPDGTIVSYAWAFGDGTTGSGVTPTHAYAVAGTFSVTLTVTDDEGIANSTTRAVRVRAAPAADFTFSPASPLVGQAVSFDASASADPDGTIVSYAWAFGDGTTGTGMTATHSYSLHGTFTVVLSVTDSDGLGGTRSKAIRVFATPIASFGFAPLVPQVGDVVAFDASASRDPDGTLSSYAWTFGDGTTGSGRTVTHAYGGHGTFRVSLRVTDSDGLWAETSVRVTVYAPPTADFTFAPAGPLPGAVVTFDGSASRDPDSAIVSYGWDFGDGVTGSGRLITHTFGTHGTFGVRLTVTGSDGLSASMTRMLRVLARPGASFAYAPSSPVEGTAVTFDASGSSDPDGTIVSYAWAFGDGTTGSGKIVAHTFARYGTYTVTLTVVDSDGLSASASSSVRILGRPLASFTYAPAKPLRGQAVVFDASASSDPDGSVASYSWTFGDGSSGIGRTVSHAYAAHGSFSVVLMVTDNEGVTGTASFVVRIYAPPSPSFTFSPLKPLEGTSVSFDASSSADPDSPIASYAWDWGDGSTTAPSGSPTVAHTFARYGTYAVRLTVTDVDGFPASTTTNVRILARPVASFVFNPAKPLPGQSVSFDASGSSDPDGTIVSYSWTFGDGATAAGATAAHAYAAYGTFTVTLTVADADGLTASTSKSVRIYSPPSPSFTYAPAKPLQGESVSFDGRGSMDADGTITAYAWTFGDGASGASAQLAHAYASYGTFTVTLTVTDSDGLSASTSKSVRIHVRPVASFTSSPTRPLRGSAVSFDASGSSDPDGTIASYRWTWGDGTSSGPFTTPAAPHTYATHGTYAVTLTVTDADGFVGEVTKTIRVYAPPSASFVVTPASPIQGQPATFDASGSTDPDGPIATYTWTWGDGTTSAALPNPTASHTYAAYGTYAVVLLVTDADGFTSSISKTVRVLAPPVASFTFTPAAPNAGQSVAFNAAGSADADGTITAYTWTFGDGTTGTGVSAAHVYLGGGNYTVVLTVTDSDGLVGSTSRVVPVIGENRPPVAAFTVTRTLMSVAVDGSPSTDPEGTIVSYAWTWGDGTTGSGVTTSHAYAAPGPYTITLRITDGGGLTSTASQQTSVAPSTLDYEYWDFFNVPYGEWWDYRTPGWGDRPMNAECFTAAAIANGVCAPARASVPDIASPPYTSWYPTPGPTTHPYDPLTNALVAAPYRMRAVGDEIPGYDRGTPVFLPVKNPSQPAGALLEFDWRVEHVDTALAGSLAAAGCPISRYEIDGYVVRSLITIRMDLQESRRLFGVVATDANSARAWWASNIATGCSPRGAAETDWQTFMVQQGGSSTMIGSYDVMNGLGWWYSPFYTAFAATVATDGVTTLTIDHASWGTDVLLARWFYWGSAPYRENHLDSSRARGWWGMEPRGLEQIAFRGTLGSASMDFTFEAVVQYHFREGALPGPDGSLNRVGDIPVWSWGPNLADVISGPNNPIQHDASELNRYAGLSYVHTTPGAWSYNVAAPYDIAPATWNLPAGHTWLFRFPTSAVPFHDPNTTPIGADPAAGEYVQTSVPWRLGATFPIAFGTWDPGTGLFRVVGPLSTGGPVGSPGNYPARAYPGIPFTP